MTDIEKKLGITHKMGIGKMGEKDIKFVRKFRFVLVGKYLNEWYNKTFYVNYTTKTITLSAYETVDESGIHIHNWADNMENGKYHDEELTLTTYDGCGHEIYKRHFSGLKLLSRENDFDYSLSDVACHLVQLTYEKCDILPVTKDVHPTTKREAEVDHLNAKLFVT